VLILFRPDAFCNETNAKIEWRCTRPMKKYARKAQTFKSIHSRTRFQIKSFLPKIKNSNELDFEDSPKLRANFMAQKTVTKVLTSYSPMRSSYAAEFKLKLL
jgi:hypothetical protein